MKITLYQPKRKVSDGTYPVYLKVGQAQERVFVKLPFRTHYPIIKAEVPMGFIFDKKEPQRRLKTLRAEELYWKIDQYAIEHPKVRPTVIKAYFDKGERGALVKAMLEYAEQDRLSKASRDIFKRTATKISEYDEKAGFGIDSEWLRGFEDFLRKSNTKVNGIGIHLRNIRTVFNYARRKGLTKEYPFLDYRIKEERQTIRNMSLEQVREFKDYPCEPWQVEYRDIFMLMVYLGGINIGDLLMCKGLVNGRLVYKRAKTDKPISLYVCPQALEIIEKYKGKDYLISPMDRYSDKYGYVGRINDGLKKIGKLEIGKDKVGRMRKHKVTPFFSGITTYVARYTFASVAADIGIERDVIAACLGHSWADVTSHYVAYSQQKMDEAVKKVADAISTK